MHVVITGVTGFRNRGVEALVRPAIQQLLEKYPGVQITVVTWSPEYDARRLSHPQVTYVEDAYLKGGQWVPPQSRPPGPFWKQIAKKVAAKVGLYTPPKTNPLAMPFANADLILVSGGDLISSDYGNRDLKHHLKPIFWAKERGIPSVLLGQSIGPFKNDLDVATFSEAAGHASLITMREPLSRRYLIDTLGLPEEKVALTADVAFLLQPDTAYAASQMPGFTSDAKVPLVGVSISESICKWTGINEEQHAEVWCQIIKRINEKWGAHVAIISHVQEAFADDRAISTLVLRKLGYPPGVRLLAEDLSAAEFKGVLQRCDMVVAERMHAAIGALSTGVCTVPIGYSIKARGIIESVLEGSGIGSEDICIPIAQFVDLDHSWSKLDSIWQDRARYRTAIQASLARSKAAAARNFELVFGLIK